MLQEEESVQADVEIATTLLHVLHSKFNIVTSFLLNNIYIVDTSSIQIL